MKQKTIVYGDVVQEESLNVQVEQDAADRNQYNYTVEISCPVVLTITDANKKAENNQELLPATENRQGLLPERDAAQSD